MIPQFMAWALLALSIISEVSGTIALKYTEGFTRIIPSGIVCICYVLAIWLMSIVIKRIELGTTYAIWAGCGTALTALLGIWLFGESASALKLAGIGMIVMGVVALNLSGA